MCGHRPFLEAWDLQEPFPARPSRAGRSRTGRRELWLRHPDPLPDPGVKDVENFIELVLTQIEV